MDGRHYKNPPPIPYKAAGSMPKLTFGTTSPYHCGWQGWRDRVEVILDGVHAGDLVGSGQNKRQMEWGLCTEHQSLRRYPAMGVTGLNKAKAAVRAALAKGEA